MHLISKVILIVFVSAILSTCIAQSKDTVIVKDSTATSDTITISDSTKIHSDSQNVKKVNKDSTGVIDSLLQMQKKFEQFEYGDVISMANRLLLYRFPYS